MALDKLFLALDAVASKWKASEYFSASGSLQRPSPASASRGTPTLCTLQLETMEVTCNLIKLKPGSLPVVRHWAKTLGSRMKEVLATLHDESVVIESVFLLGQDDDHYLVYYVRAQCMEKAGKAVQSFQHEIAAIHQEFKENAWESSESIELLLDASTLEQVLDLYI